MFRKSNKQSTRTRKLRFESLEDRIHLSVTPFHVDWDWDLNPEVGEIGHFSTGLYAPELDVALDESPNVVVAAMHGQGGLSLGETFGLTSGTGSIGGSGSIFGTYGTDGQGTLSGGGTLGGTYTNPSGTGTWSGGVSGSLGTGGSWTIGAGVTGSF